MKKLLVLISLLLVSCTTPAPIAVKGPVVKPPVKVVSQPPDIYLMCSGKMFKGVVVAVNGVEAVYRCPDEAK